MDSLSITFGMGVDDELRPASSNLIEVAAEIAWAKSSAKRLIGRMPYLLPHQFRQIKDSADVIANFDGKEYRFVRLDADGSFELRRDA